MTSSLDPRELALHNRYERGLVTSDTHVLSVAGQVANEQAAQGVFADYLSRKADNALRRQAADPARFAEFLNQRVRVLGQVVGLEGLSAHDCRHYWATTWARKVDVLRLQEAGGWSKPGHAAPLCGRQRNRQRGDGVNGRVP